MQLIPIVRRYAVNLSSDAKLIKVMNARVFTRPAISQNGFCDFLTDMIRGQTAIPQRY